MGKGKLKEFIKRAGKVVPEVLNVVTMLGTGNVLGAISSIGDALKGASNQNKEAKKLLEEFELRKEELALEGFKLEIQDREGARNLYTTDNWIQKALAIIFVFGYSILCWYLLLIVSGNKELPALAETLITMIWTATSTKLNTIVDFFFGGSMKG